MLSDESTADKMSGDSTSGAAVKRKVKAKPPLLAAVHTQLGEPTTDGPLGKIERAQRRKRASVPANDDPVAELRRLVQDHKALTKKATAIKNMTVDKKNRTTGETIPSRVPDDRAHEMLAIVKALQGDATRLESAMLRELRKVPIYTTLLQRVYGLGPIVCAYLVALIDIHKATKISNLRRFCGLAVINGRLERPTRGVKLGYCGELRTRLYQAMAAMWKNSAKKTAERPNGATSKYLDVWRGYKHRMLQSERYDAARNVLMNERCGAIESEPLRASDSERSDANVAERARESSRANAVLHIRVNDVDRILHEHSGRAHVSEYAAVGASEFTRVNTEVRERTAPQAGEKGRPGARALIHATGWHKAADVLIEDIYTVWRAIEGLPVWPSYYAAKLGFNHGGSISVNAPRMLTVDEALTIVGDVGARPATAPVEDIAIPDEDEEP